MHTFVFKYNVNKYFKYRKYFRNKFFIFLLEKYFKYVKNLVITKLDFKR